MPVHPTAVIDPTAVIGPNVDIGPYAVIGPQVSVGAGSRIAAHAVLEGYTRLGEGCQVSPGAVLGGLPQDLHFGGEESWVVVGDRTVIRECVTVNRATGAGKETRVGSDCMIMAYCHVAHNCTLGDGVILANNVQIAGHVDIGDFAFISGTCVFHQFVRIGRLAIIGGFSGSRQDIPPFSMNAGRPQATIVGINKVGLRRRGVNAEQRARIKRAYQLLWFSRLSQTDAVAAIREEIGPDPLVDELLEFVLTSRRGIHRPDEGVRFDEEASLDAVAL